MYHIYLYPSIHPPQIHKIKVKVHNLINIKCFIINNIKQPPLKLLALFLINVELSTLSQSFWIYYFEIFFVQMLCLILTKPAILPW